jgi:hypothetical protein
MRFGIVCDVDSKIFLGSGYTLEHGKKVFVFYVSHETGFLNQVRVISQVTEPTKYYLKKVNPALARFGESFEYEPELADELLGDLQLIESLLALMGNLKRVHWERPTYEYYPETEDEHSRIEITPSWFYRWEFRRDDPTQLNVLGLSKAIMGADFLRPLAPLMSFYREGMNEIRLGRYINAFFNFYFIIEGLFAAGKSRMNEVIRKYLDSQVLMPFIDTVIARVGANDNLDEGMTKEQLERELQSRAQPFTSEGLVRFLVKKRGELHHFSIESSRQQGTPLNNMDYKLIAHIVHELAGNSLTHYIAEAEAAQNAASQLSTELSPSGS